MSYSTPPVNAPGLDTTSIIQQQNLLSRKSAQELQVAMDSGGESDYLCDRTPNVMGMLGTKRTLDEATTHILNDTKINSRSQGQIEFIELCQNIAIELGKRLSLVKTDNGMPDQTFSVWCQQQLTNIANAGNKTLFDGTYACASGTVYQPPMNTTQILAPLGVGAPPTFDYTVGSFNAYDARLSPSLAAMDSFDARHAGVEEIIRSLRVCLNGNVNNSGDPAWAFALNLLNTQATPNLSLALNVAGTLGSQAQEASEQQKDHITSLSSQYQQYGFISQAQMISDQAQASALNKIQQSSIFQNLMETKNFLNKMDQIF